MSTADVLADYGTFMSKGFCFVDVANVCIIIKCWRNILANMTLLNIECFEDSLFRFEKK